MEVTMEVSPRQDEWLSGLLYTNNCFSNFTLHPYLWEIRRNEEIGFSATVRSNTENICSSCVCMRDGQSVKWNIM